MAEHSSIGDFVCKNEETISNGTSEITTDVKTSNEICQKVNEETQNKNVEYEKVLIQERLKFAALQKDLQIRTEERDHFKNQASNLEKELIKTSLNDKKDKQDDANDVVARASSVIFEKTKVCKNQELQIEALTQQVKSLKEIVAITKDMLEIRNMEVQQLQNKLECVELKFTAEKERQTLMHVKLDKMVKLNADLKIEYEKQLSLFSELQKAYIKQRDTTEQNK